MTGENMEAYWLYRLGAAAVLGGLIGLERQIHGRPAGLRTHMLVCLGASLITLAGASFFGDSGEAGSVGLSRIAAGVVTGIGFLGAGAIIRTGDFVRGLTTAACIWFVAAMGVVVGIGYVLISAICCGLALAILTLLDYLEHMIPPLTYGKLRVRACTTDPGSLAGRCTDVLRSVGGVRIMAVSLSRLDAETHTAELDLTVATRHRKKSLEPVLRLAALEGVMSVSSLGSVAE
ncbi:MgtC/SapB family protein [Candidatus Fermentibacterales bacterium]|nr:MgtC/SapB family protein [Candidatus Fermentibacterales bacterium]